MKTFNFNREKAKKAIKLLLESFGEDLEREGIKHTPERVADFYKELLSGNEMDPSKFIPAPYSTENHEEIILVKDIPFYSICEHHLLPFFGRANVAYIPKKDRIIGVSKIIKLIEVFASRLQLQERLIKEIADIVMQCVKPHGVMVVVEAEHLCMTMRGVKKPGSKVVTSAMRGIFLKDLRTRSEAMSLLKV
ncbi:MAG: GTP cyclohydrolase I FolE [Endomicrobiia bacterium]|nr:MAG: GTP cyclohydrolase I FolE [Endomicrobiia bacterium]